MLGFALIFANLSLTWINILGSLVFALLVPYVAIGRTLLYFDLQRARRRPRRAQAAPVVVARAPEPAARHGRRAAAAGIGTGLRTRRGGGVGTGDDRYGSPGPERAQSTWPSPSIRERSSTSSHWCSMRLSFATASGGCSATSASRAAALASSVAAAGATLCDEAPAKRLLGV